MDDTFRSQFRLPWPLHDELKRTAAKNRRTLNAELVARLESTFPQLNVGEFAEVEHLRETISKMSLAEVMTPAEITMFAERMLQIASNARGTR